MEKLTSATVIISDWLSRVKTKEKTDSGRCWPGTPSVTTFPECTLGFEAPSNQSGAQPVPRSLPSALLKLFPARSTKKRLGIRRPSAVWRASIKLSENKKTDNF